LAPSLRAGAWRSLAEEWAAGIAASMGPDYRAQGSDAFVLVSNGDARYTELALERCQSFRRTLVAALPDLAFAGHEGPLLLFAGAQTDYYRFIATFYGDGNHPGSAGLFTSGDGWDVLAWTIVTLSNDEHVIAHELTHAALASLPAIPVWLNEGMATTFERRLTNANRPFAPDHDERGRVAALFRKITISDFLRGRPFDVSGDFHDAAYLVAEALVTRLERLDGWRTFLAKANRANAGTRAASEHLGIDLVEEATLVVASLSAGGLEPVQSEDCEPPSPEEFESPTDLEIAPATLNHRGLLMIGLVVVGLLVLRGCL
jgi:hypothetical protein